jgi:hypothetical protein
MSAVMALQVTHLVHYERPYLVQDSWVATVCDDLILREFDDLPFVANTVSDAVLDELVSVDWIDNFIEPFEMRSNRCLTEFLPVDMSVFANDEIVSAWFDEELVQSEYPIGRNTATDADISDILNGLPFDGLNQFIPTEVEVLAVPPIDRTCYCSEETAWAIFDSLFELLKYPFVPNTLEEDDVLAMVLLGQLSVDSTVPSTDDPVSPLQRLKFTDIQMFVNDYEANAILDETFRLCENLLPLTSNAIPEALLEEVVGPDTFSNVEQLVFVPPLCYLHALDPIHRRIDFGFSIPLDSLYPKEIPIVPNSVSLETSAAIVSTLGSLEVFDYGLTGLNPLRRFLAPDEFSESLDEIAEHLVEMILVLDVLPVIPMYEDIIISHKLAHSLLTSIFNPRLALSTVPDAPVSILANLPPIDIPKFKTYEDIMREELWENVLPFLPLETVKSQRRTMDELIDTLGLCGLDDDEEYSSDD